MKQLAIAAIVIVVAAVAFALLPVGDGIEWLVRAIRGTGAIGLVVFVLVFEIATLALLPTVELFVASGMIYGFAWGAILSTAVSFTAAIIAFVLGRTVLRRRIERIAKRHETLANIDRALGEHAFTIALLLRLTPAVPLGPLNYALAAAPISWRTYAAASLLGMLPGHLLWSYLGSLLHSASELGNAARGVWSQVLVWATLIGGVALTVVIGRVAQRALEHRRR